MRSTVLPPNSFGLSFAFCSIFLAITLRTHSIRGLVVLSKFYGAWHSTWIHDVLFIMFVVFFEIFSSEMVDIEKKVGSNISANHEYNTDL